MNEVKSKILKLAEEIFDRSVDFEENRAMILEWDSIAHVILISRVEEEFGVTIPIEDTSKITKLSDFLKYFTNNP